MQHAMSSRFFNARILVVDDSEFQLRLVSSALAKAGFQRVDRASDGVEALEKTRSFMPDLVILDLNMPKLDGFGYCEEVRKEPALARIPILVQTASEERASKLRALSCGADDFLSKPLDPDELILRARIHLGRYFMLQDMGDMCAYLKMELEQMELMLKHIEQSSVSPATLNQLNRHREVLETMAGIPILGDHYISL